MNLQAIRATEKEIVRITQEVIPGMRHKQLRRHIELTRQQIYQQRDASHPSHQSH